MERGGNDGMKMMMRNAGRHLLLTFAFACLMGMTVFAAVEKIDIVRLSFSCDPVPAAGEAPGTVTVKTASNEFAVESAGYMNDVDAWTLGERPEVEVVLRAAEGFRFSYTSSSHFKLSGCGADFVRAKVYDNGNTLILRNYLKRADGKPEEVYGLEWSGSYALWEASEEEGIKSYEVRLYRNKKLVTTVTTTKTDYDFRSYITQSGDYTFRVRAVAKYENRAGAWSDDSEESTFSEYEARYYGQGSWIQNQYGWWYRYHNGDYPVNCWKNINNAWYYFNQDGYMLRGWQLIDGNWYYLDGSGAMLNGGWHFINGYWFYLEGNGVMQKGWKNLDGRWYFLNGDGVMLTGWQDINGNWYYLDESGAMYADRITPDGFYVDSSGRRR